MFDCNCYCFGLSLDTGVDEQTSGTPPVTSATQTADTEPADAGMIFEYFYYFVPDHIDTHPESASVVS